MAGSVNKVLLIGRLGGDPEIRRTQDGRPVVSFSLATSERWKDKATGERREHTDWHKVVIFNEPLCKVAEQYLKKGALVFIEAKLETRKWKDKDGADRWTTEIVLKAFKSELTMLESSGAGAGDGDSDRGSATGGGGGSAAPSPAGRGDRGARDVDDEIPF
jgi:single-strand DNA-binding protein